MTPSIKGFESRAIFTPTGGWKESTYYLCEVAFSKTNVIHRSIFYTGFLNGNEAGTEPGGYSGFLAAPDPEDGPMDLDDVFYLKPVVELLDEDMNVIASEVSAEIEIPNG